PFRRAGDYRRTRSCPCRRRRGGPRAPRTRRAERPVRSRTERGRCGTECYSRASFLASSSRSFGGGVRAIEEAARERRVGVASYIGEGREAPGAAKEKLFPFACGAKFERAGTDSVRKTT